MVGTLNAGTLSYTQAEIDSLLSTIPEAYDLPLADGYVDAPYATEAVNTYCKSKNGLVIVHIGVIREGQDEFSVGVHVVGSLPSGFRPARSISAAVAYATTYGEPNLSAATKGAIRVVVSSFDGTLRINPGISGIKLIEGTLVFFAGK